MTYEYKSSDTYSDLLDALGLTIHFNKQQYTAVEKRSAETSLQERLLT